MLCVTAVSAVVLPLACPEPFSVPLFRRTVLVVVSVIVTVPVGTPLPAVTASVAVSVTDWPYVGDAGDDETAVVVGIFTVSPALAVLPVPPLVELTAPLVLVYEPSTAVVTLAEIVQEELTPTVPPLR